MSDELGEYKYLWDGSEKGWVLIEAPDAPGEYGVFNELTSVALLIDDDEINRRVTLRMKAMGCKVLDRVPGSPPQVDPHQ